jgi:hypothetical protein
MVRLVTPILLPHRAGSKGAMAEELPAIVLPPWAPLEISKRDYQEGKLDVALRLCWSGGYFDEQRALDLLRSYAIVIFDLELDVYRTRSWYSPKWISAIMKESLQRVEQCFSLHCNGDPREHRQVLVNTVFLHIKTHPTLAHVFLSSLKESPLLMMVRDAQSQVEIKTPDMPSHESLVVQIDQDDGLAKRRAALLAGYKEHTGDPSNKKIYEASNSGIHKPEFYQWLNGKLLDTSRTTKRFEDFLRSKRKVVPRNPPSDN